MIKQSLSKTTIYVQQNITFILILSVIVFLDIFSFNHQFFVNTIFNLKELELEILDGTLYGFEVVNGSLVSEHNDPNLTFRDLDRRVRFIKLECFNSNPDSLSQIFYRRVDEDFSQDKSITFFPNQANPIVSLPSTTNINSLRFDLTNIEGDIVNCENIIINPHTPYSFSPLRIGLLLLSLIGLTFGNKLIPQKLSNAVWNYFINYSLWIFILLIILISLAYPVTITFDSAHYLWLANLIKLGEWESWDNIRYLGFPLQIYISILIFGYHQIALLLPMIIAHIILFIFSCKLVFAVFDTPKNLSRFLIMLSIFLLVTVDPTIFGYFHTLLTEYLAATIAIVSSYLAISLYKAPFLSKRFYIISSIAVILVPITWHIKQPYVGAAVLPFVISCLLIVFRKFSKSTITFSLIANIVVALLVFTTTIAWNSFLEVRGNPLRDDRQITNFVGRYVAREVNTAKKSSIPSFVNTQISKYLESANFIPRESPDSKSLIYGFQNRLIAHHMLLSPGQTNILYNFQFYHPYSDPFQVVNTPPGWINNLFVNRTTTSHTLFTLSYIALPFLFIGYGILFIFQKSTFNAAILILSGTSLISALIHLILGALDRYLFFGYPLLLIIFLLIITKIIFYLQSNNARKSA